MKRPLMIVIGFFFLIVLVIPSLIVLPFSSSSKSEAQTEKKPQQKAMTVSKAQDLAVPVSVYRSATQKVDKLQLRDYLIGVVASEMPADFNIEALKAQALTARTYIVRRLVDKDDLGDSAGNAVVGDTTAYQVFKSNDELKKVWGKDYAWKIKKIEKAVDDTADQIITYKDEPITASFFSTSNGQTENAEDYWSNPIPYLKSVSSPWDIGTPKYKQTISKPVTTVQEKLGVTLNAEDGPIGTNKKLTEGKQIASIVIGGKTFTGRDVREKLGLASADFTMERKGDMILITTKGNGHGVGMSQYGANGMAEDGKTDEQIVKHYYKGVKIEKAEPFLNKMTAKK
ncbi:stage II sporulation protein D [Pullulanibacillus pueri]|uniref:Stage II sporulation protein D n=1 Tax=Pullulanibacillus pueri TaxID=1437324 RepID=A0A8J3EMQ6_9BACL|nr:stage II sporulation protein D [Pullulanibacillus pueri]MBM7681742.1 stage II sporulation protein D [Pullulanibacillus pueri]GGH84110.1 stage II sporulation protein D [Pullulanibacillus pueri]